MVGTVNVGNMCLLNTTEVEPRWTLRLAVSPTSFFGRKEELTRHGEQLSTSSQAALGPGPIKDPFHHISSWNVWNFMPYLTLVCESKGQLHQVATKSTVC